MTSMQILKIEKEQLNEAAKIIREGFNTVVNTYGLTKETARGNSAFLNNDKLISDWHKGSLMYGVFYHNTLVGFIQLDKKGAKELYIKHFTVLEQYRNKGLGIALIEFSINKAIQLGVNYLTLGFMATDTKLKDFYKNRGFKVKNTKSFKGFNYKVTFMELKIN